MIEHQRHQDDRPAISEETDQKGLTRRSFLTTMGVGAAAAAVSGHLTAESANAAVEAGADERIPVTLNVNGNPYRIVVEPRWTLLFVLREKLGFTGSKTGCERGECGACTVLIDDLPRYACMTLVVEAQGSKIVTVEGLMDGETLGDVQQAFLEEDAYQCGYCTSGQIMSVEGLLRKDPHPTDEAVRTAMSGNICRCGAYKFIHNAAKRAADTRGGKGGKA